MSGYCDAAPGHEWHGPYHDREYGFPLTGDAELYERLMLEINQAGLSWLTILRKREGFRRAYEGFDPERVARYEAREKRRLLADAGIIRNRLKIEAAIANARTVLELRESHGSFAGWLDAHLFVEEPETARGRHLRGTDGAVRPRSKPEWVTLFRKTFRFTGGEIVGEFLLSTGYLPGAHRESCPVYPRILRLRPAWSRTPGRAGPAAAGAPGVTPARRPARRPRG
ncbi:MAG TPA: DNA-3-methyladenine glycosylase I [Gemmatimonadales bacterium]|nr:DNA-3-methyladenine glycosylase I [Gemmatimonadales bacterium]